MSAVPKGVWAILALALVVRLGAAWLITDQLTVGADEHGYISLATSIADGDGFPPRPFLADGGPSATFAPGFAYFLGGVFELSGDSTVAARVMQALLGTGVVALLGWISWQLFRDRGAALAALGIGALYPSLVTSGVALMTEPLFLVLELAAVAAALRWREAGAIGWAAAAGALAGLAALTKSVGLIVATLVVVGLWLKPRAARSSLFAPGLALIACLVVLAPWTIRNAAAFDAFVPVSNELGYGLAGAFNDQTRLDPGHEWRSPYVVPAYERDLLDPSIDEAQLARRLESKAADFAGEHPGYPFALAFENLRRLLQLDGAPTRTDAELIGFEADGETLFDLIFWAALAGFVVVAGLAVATLAGGRASAVPGFIWGLVVLSVLPLLLISGGPRFRLPADVLLIVIGSPVAADLVRRLRTRQAYAE